MEITIRTARFVPLAMIAASIGSTAVGKEAESRLLVSAIVQDVARPGASYQFYADRLTKGMKIAFKKQGIDLTIEKPEARTTTFSVPRNRYEEAIELWEAQPSAGSVLPNWADIRNNDARPGEPLLRVVRHYRWTPVATMRVWSKDKAAIKAAHARLTKVEAHLNRAGLDTRRSRHGAYGAIPDTIYLGVKLDYENAAIDALVDLLEDHPSGLAPVYLRLDSRGAIDGKLNSRAR